MAGSASLGSPDKETSFFGQIKKNSNPDSLEAIAVIASFMLIFYVTLRLGVFFTLLLSLSNPILAGIPYFIGSSMENSKHGFLIYFLTSPILYFGYLYFSYTSGKHNFTFREFLRKKDTALFLIPVIIAPYLIFTPWDSGLFGFLALFLGLPLLGPLGFVLIVALPFVVFIAIALLYIKIEIYSIRRVRQ